VNLEEAVMWRSLWIVWVVSQIVAEPLIGAEPKTHAAGSSAGSLPVPLAFVENRGQWDAGVSFAAYRLGATAVLGREGIELAA
jgi:hypothetical protein